MPEPNNHLTLRPLRTPRAAAIAGIIFSVLLSMILVLMRVSVETGRGLNTGASDATSLAVGLVPFAGIAFLWFMGVVRDRLGHLEDQFFSTIYFGSGLLFLAMLFIWAAIAGTILTGFDLDTGVLADDRSGYAFGRMLMDEITSVYALRMAGVFMISTGVIWTSTGVMPRWLAIITLGVALGLLVGMGFIFFFWWLPLSFPAWVLLVSIYILRTS
jgi:hypothetical protein